MLTPNNKLSVFISSACGKGKERYNVIRKQLKTSIEETNLANVYLFEGTQASTLSARQHFLYALQDSDVCIFLIDNADGVPIGVQEEIDCVKKHSIKSLFYFCDQESNEPTPLQKSLMGAKFAKSKIVNSFDDFANNCYQGLIDDLILIYKYYCSGRLVDPNFQEQIDTKGFALQDTYFRALYIMPKTIIDNSDKCRGYFLQLVRGRENTEIENTNEIDKWCFHFLPVLFEGKTISDFNVNLFLKELKKHQPNEYFTAVSKRWDAIQAYYLGDLQSTVALLQDALNYAKMMQLPDWFIKDILIDLRNQSGYLGESKNKYIENISAQQEISDSEQALYYPLMDRIQSTLNSKLTECFFKEKIKSPFTISYGNTIYQYTELISSAYIIAMFNGSLTYMMQLSKYLKNLSFSLCEKYSDWEFRILLLKTCIVNYNKNEIDGITKAFPEILNMMNSSDALSIYQFCSNSTINYQSLISKFEAYKVIGYFLDDNEFERITGELFTEIRNWLNDDNRTNTICNHLFSCLSGAALRIKQDDLADICCSFLELKFRRWYHDMFKFISDHIDLNELTGGVARRLIDNFITLLRDEDVTNCRPYLDQVLFTFRKQNKDLTDVLDKTIAEKLPDFYNDTYKLETTDTKECDYPEFIRKNVALIRKQNSEQGKNGVHYGYGDQPHTTIRSILVESELDYDASLIDEIFLASSETLLGSKHDIETKCEAIDLIICLCFRFPNVLERNRVIVDMLRNPESISQICDHEFFMSNLTEVVLKFSSTLLYNCFGDNTWLRIIEILPYLNDSISGQVRVSKTALLFFMANRSTIIDQRLESLFLQQALIWASSDNLTIRMNATRILFLLLRNSENSSVVCSQLIRAIDSDNYYIKNLIQRKAYKNMAVDEATREYIVAKCSIDVNFTVRMVCEKLKQS
jgi:hypothetical protein